MPLIEATTLDALHEVYDRVDHLLRLLCACDDDDQVRSSWRDARLVDVSGCPQRVPRPLRRLIVAADEAPTCAGFDGPQYARSFAQRAVYARLADENALRWFECAICAHTKFVPTERATQHCVRHPPVCVPCLRRLLYCPFCRKWIGAAGLRRLCLRVLRPSSPPLGPFSSQDPGVAIPLPLPLRRSSTGIGESVRELT